ncbi:hypothetical protein P5673_021165 [Acropora cervicornis]|uniref:Uncharacterized protein n=1 Tax=Acropora cervicornis TaxID=6130 RepID=A0AAD9Q8K1_ACRCE|nr:hypothetical protein P5673_021165 [Acropora cervicornis]
MKITLGFLFTLLLLCAVYSEEQQPPELSAKNVHVNCITFLGEKVCQVSCKAKFVPKRPHANSYTYFNGQWTTDPEGYEFPWADCVSRLAPGIKSS